MSNLTAKDALGVSQSIKASGDGSGGDPLVIHHNIDTIADGGDVSLGAKADSSAATDTGTYSLIALFKRLLERVTVLLGYFKAEDAGHSSGDTGVMALAVRNDTPGSLAGTDLDYGPLQLNSTGELRVAVSSSISLAGAVDTELTTADLDTGGGTDTRAVVGLAMAESGGAVLMGSANPVPNNLAKVGGTAVDTNSGSKSGGTLRVVIATDQPALSNALLVDSELPAAASLADATANPSTTSVGAYLMVWQGVGGWTRLRAADTHKDLSTVAAGSIVTVWTPASGKKVRLMGGTISVSAACSILFEDNSGGNTVWRTPKLLADTPYNFDLGNGYLLSAANNVLKATSSAAANVTGTLYGIEES